MNTEASNQTTNLANPGRSFNDSGRIANTTATPTEAVDNSVSSGEALAAANVEGSEILAAQLEQALGLQREIFEQTREDLEPWRDAGQRALGQITAGIESGEFDPGKFQFTFTEDDPSYQFRFNEGIRALDNSAAARGRLNSGAQGRALQRYGQGLASTEFNSAFSRALQTWDTDRLRGNDKFNRLSGVSGTGLNATGATANAGSRFSGQASSTLGAIGQARATGLVGAEEARFSAYQTEQDRLISQQRFDQNRSDRRDNAAGDLFGTVVGTVLGIKAI